MPQVRTCKSNGGIGALLFLANAEPGEECLPQYPDTFGSCDGDATPLETYTPVFGVLSRNQGRYLEVRKHEMQ